MKNSQNIFDLIIIGAGPSGLMTAITASTEQPDLRILVLEQKNRIGAKLLMSGGGRCNVTNQRVCESDYVAGQTRTVRNILAGFTSKQTVAFFKSLGVEMVPEEEGKLFPATQSARTVLEALLRVLSERQIRLETSQRTNSVKRTDGTFEVAGKGFRYFARAVVLGTGGLSYPETGSDGSGYVLAKALGHQVIPTLPALTPLTTHDPDWKNLTGISLPVRLTLDCGQRKGAVSQGALLFTHFGFSGPSVLDISRHWLCLKSQKPSLVVNFLPFEIESEFLERLIENGQKNPKGSVKKFCSQKLPERLVEVLFRKGDIPEAISFAELSRSKRGALVRALFHCPVEISGTLGYAKAEATAGGIDMKEVDPRTLGSKFCPGLFFAGEILDVDGRIGGFNLQWAWSSGVAAGRATARFLMGLDSKNR